MDETTPHDTCHVEENPGEEGFEPFVSLNHAYSDESNTEIKCMNVIIYKRNVWVQVNIHLRIQQSQSDKVTNVLHTQSFHHNVLQNNVNSRKSRGTKWNR